MFWNADSFNSDLSKWNVANVEDMSYSTFEFPLHVFNLLSITFFLSSSLFPCLIFIYFLRSQNLYTIDSLSFSLESLSVFYRNFVFNSDLSKWNVAKVNSMVASTFQSSCLLLQALFSFFFLIFFNFLSPNNIYFSLFFPFS